MVEVHQQARLGRPVIGIDEGGAAIERVAVIGEHLAHHGGQQRVTRRDQFGHLAAVESNVVLVEGDPGVAVVHRTLA